MKHILRVEIDTEDAHKADIIRDEIVGAVEDFNESFRPGFNVSVGELVTVGSDRELSIIELARERHCLTDDRQVEESGIVSESDGGAWVQGWLWVPASEINAAAGTQGELEPVESEGGHCD